MTEGDCQAGGAWEWDIHHFGRDYGNEKLELAIAPEKDRIVISERKGEVEIQKVGQVGMFLDEVKELLDILGRELVLELLGDIDDAADS